MRAQSLICPCAGLKHCVIPSVKHWFIPNDDCGLQNQRMLDSETLAKRIRDAMDNHKPNRITASKLATAFGVTPQAINGWRKTGRIGKGRLLKLARITGKPASYFLGDEIDESLEAQAFKLAEDWLALKNPSYRAAVRDTLDKLTEAMEKFPALEFTMDNDTVSRYIAPAGKSASILRPDHSHHKKPHSRQRALQLPKPKKDD